MVSATVTYRTCVIRIGFEIGRLELQALRAPWRPRLKSRRSAMSPMSRCARYATMESLTGGRRILVPPGGA